MININHDQTNFDIEKQNLSVNISNNFIPTIIIRIFVSIYFIVLFFSLITCFTLIMVDLQNFKYCANNHDNCEYLPTDGKLCSNKINIKYDNFETKYELVSSYNYTLDSIIHTCKDLETHVYYSYDEVLIASKKSIGYTKKIYYNKNYLNECVLYYEWYYSKYFYFAYIVFIFFGFNFLLIFLKCIHVYKTNSI